MWAQVIQAKCNDKDGLKRQLERWQSELKPSAVGYLGSTGGVAEDGEFIMLARFESEEKARENSSSDAQTAWWNETEKYLSDVRFYDCTEVDLWAGGGSDDARFVQVIQGVAKDKAKMREMGREMENQPPRPDVIGGIVGWQGDNFSQFVYFTSEEEARKGESQESDDAPDWNQFVDDLKFIDIKEPWLFSR